MYDPNAPATTPSPPPAEVPAAAPDVAASDPATALVDDRDVAASHTPPAPPEAPAREHVDQLTAGNLVEFVYHDAAGNPITRRGLVVDVTDEHDPGNGDGAVVAWFGEFSDPIPFDQLERIDG